MIPRHAHGRHQSVFLLNLLPRLRVYLERAPRTSLVLSSRLVLRQASDNLDLIRIKLLVIVHLKVNIFDDESPDFVAEAVGVEVALPNRSGQ